MKLIGDGPFVVHDLSIEHQGSQWADVVEVDGGEIISATAALQAEFGIKRGSRVGAVFTYWDK